MNYDLIVFRFNIYEIQRLAGADMQACRQCKGEKGWMLHGTWMRCNACRGRGVK